MALVKKASNVTAEQKIQQTAQVEQEVKAADPIKEEIVAQVEEIVVEAEAVEEVVEVEAELVEEEVVAKPAPTKVQSKPTNVVATQQQPQAKSNLPTTSVVSSAAKFSANAAEQGFEGLEVGGYGTFPTIVIGTGGCFELDGEDQEFKTFKGRLETSRKLYLCLQDGVTDGPTAFTYDKENLTAAQDGCETVDDLRRKWESEAETLIFREYLELLIENVDEESEHFENFFIVKIPPASVNKLNGILFLAGNRGTPLNTVTIEFGIGARRENKNGSKYTPWTFKQVK